MSTKHLIDGDRLESIIADAIEWADHIKRLVIYPSSPSYITDDDARRRVVDAITRQVNLLRYAERVVNGDVTNVEIRPGRPIE